MASADTRITNSDMMGNSCGTKRVVWLDVARVISMFLVMQCHSYAGMAVLHGQQHFAAGAVGVFFALSGYFSRFKSWKTHANRLIAFSCFYFFYSIYALTIMRHGVITSFSDVVSQLIHPSASAMWFLQYLMLAIVFLPFIEKMALALKIVVASALLIWGGLDFGFGEYTHISMCLPFALSLYLFGNVVRSVNPEYLKRYLLRLRISSAGLLVMGGLVILSFYVYSIFQMNFISQLCSVWLVMWAILVVSKGMESCMPKVAAAIATAGAAVVFVFGFHMPTLRVYVSAWLRLFGDWPPVWVDYTVLILMMAGCSLVYHCVSGRNKWVDAFLFAK